MRLHITCRNALRAQPVAGKNSVPVSSFTLDTDMGGKMNQGFESFTAPFTRSGRSAIVPSPPWHYAGWLMNVAISCDTSNSDAVVHSALGSLTGKGCIHFVEWQATTDGHELVDPVYAQYRETIVIVEIQ